MTRNHLNTDGDSSFSVAFSLIMIMLPKKFLFPYLFCCKLNQDFTWVEPISLNHCCNSNNIHTIKKSNEMDLKIFKEGNPSAHVKKERNISWFH